MRNTTKPVIFSVCYVINSGAAAVTAAITPALFRLRPPAAVPSGAKLPAAMSPFAIPPAAAPPATPKPTPMRPVCMPSIPLF